MRISKRSFLIFSFLFVFVLSSFAQKQKHDASQDEAKVKDIIAFLEYVLNTLGSSTTSSRDKDVLIKESYSKIFRDAKVQVEDDLDERRKVITNKDVVAYLKDVDFFYTDVKFEFTIDNIKGGTSANGTYFYKVSARRNLKGTTSGGKAVSNTIPRFIEVNYDPQAQDLKIVSIYTREFNEKEALTNWWKQLSHEWHAIFMRKMNLTDTDSIQLSDIKNMVSINDLDLSNNEYIQDVEPLSPLVNLRKLNLSRTNITDLTPIRNLTELVELNVSHTQVQDLSPLKYSSNLVRLNVSTTQVNDLSVLEKMTNLQYLNASAVPVSDFNPLSFAIGLNSLNLEASDIFDLSPLDSLNQLTELNVAKTKVTDISPLKELKNLKSLDIDSTSIQNLGPLSTVAGLQVLSANYSQIENLQPLQKLPDLEKIYCDQTRITRMVAESFMAANPKVLVVFDSKDLKIWWDTLPSQWQSVFSETAGVGIAPSKDELAKITTLDSINLLDKYSIFDLEPLRKLPTLRTLVVDKTAVHDLSPLKDHRQISYLDISNTEIKDLSIVSQFTKLKELRADKTKVEDLAPLYSLTSLQKVYVDQTTIQDINAQEFLEKNPKCLLIYKTNHLNRWWGSISPDWKNIFQEQMAKDTTSSRENLHRLVEKESLNFKDVSVNDLSALGEFVRLKELKFSGTMISNFEPLANMKSLRIIQATSSPIQLTEALSQLTELEELDISSTPVDELKVIGSLTKLKKLNCSGTKVKKLDPLGKAEQLEFLDCSNTFVSRIDVLQNLPLRILKCYNTKVSSKAVDKFKKNKPDCEVMYYR